MAQANITQRTSSRPARKPDPARIVQSYLHICDRDGKRHAFQTTAQIYGISHMTVRRIVERHEVAQNVAEVPPELRYTPPPFANPEPVMPFVDIATLTELSQPDEATSEDITSSDTFTSEAEPQETTNDGAEPSQPETSQIHSVELETPMIAMPETSQQVVVRERVRIVRLPAETPRKGIYDRLADLQVESIMGPELGAAVALLLILVTFWGLR